MTMPVLFVYSSAFFSCPLRSFFSPFFLLLYFASLSAHIYLSRFYCFFLYMGNGHRATFFAVDSFSLSSLFLVSLLAWDLVFFFSFFLHWLGASTCEAF